MFFWIKLTTKTKEKTKDIFQDCIMEFLHYCSTRSWKNLNCSFSGLQCENLNVFVD